MRNDLLAFPLSTLTVANVGLNWLELRLKRESGDGAVAGSNPAVGFFELSRLTVPHERNPMQLCSAGHEEICYECRSCPACELLDANNDLRQELKELHRENDDLADDVLRLQSEIDDLQDMDA